uniref:Uncharacterized protein n=1 Tax=Ditylenchus dipsaci TaxID=166011 RepID=A0A915D571_9BILA
MELDTSFLSEDDSQIYAREPLEECRMHVCPHDRVSLESVFKAEVKAVNRSTVEELLNHYGIGVAMVAANSSFHEDPFINFHDSHSRRLRTGLDICIDCVRTIKRDAAFKSNIGNCIDLTKTLILKQRTNDPNRDNPQPIEHPPPDAVWVSEKHLRSFKKLAVE